MVGDSRLAWPDILVMCGYFLSVLGVGVWSSRKGQGSTMSGYFLASRNMNWLLVGGSLFASNIGSGHFIGLAGAGAASGVAAHGYEQGAIYGLLLLGWVFVPVYMSAGVYTMPEYLTMRYGGHRIRVTLTCLSLVLYIFTKIAVDLYAGALFIQQAMNQTSQGALYGSVAVLLAVAAVFTIAGGLTTVVYTDMLQTILMVVGSFVLAGMSFHAVGGYRNLVESFPYAMPTVVSLDAHNQTCGRPSPYYMNLLRPIDSENHDYPWLGMTVGMAVLQVWYWCTDQVIVQRTLASRSMLHAKGGTIFAAYLKYLPLWIMTFPGMAARILYPDRVACSTAEQCMAVCGSERGCTNSAYVELVLNLLPAGLRGLMLAVMMAALMSSLTSVFNSASTIVSVDIWRLLRTNGPLWCRGSPSELEMIVVGRISVVLLVVASVIWIPVIQNSTNTELFNYINTIIAALCSPICALFVLALFCPRVNEQGAFWGFVTGLVVGTVRFVAEFSYAVPPCGSDEPDLRPAFIKNMVGTVHYMHFALLCWWVTVLMAYSVSLVTKPIPAERLYRLTFWSRRDPRIRLAKEPSSTQQRQDKQYSRGDVENSPSQAQDRNQHTTDMWWWRAVLRVCGSSDAAEAEGQPRLTAADLTEEEKAQRAAEFLKEPPYWRRIVNINAVICLTLSSFVYGFYA
ncbi:sodium/glucose cotransporter 4-like isoform X1 [Portunus trituberculatus]|uniref:sodium/glucose cotransporter 4-like isoform X1 n=2 Tax=Portunus trituberculatus TaxID=210409 RepID=UPI001E1CC679|nr:sodium/glucose cotransporter 4-like isoform X1 [Portunus trituberculatus]